MRFPSHLFQLSTIRSEPLMAAMAAVAIGMFVGNWVLGPAITRDTGEVPVQTSQERPTLQDLVSRPDPMPYRAPTPSFDMSGPPNYAAVAKEKAQAELGGQSVDDEPAPEPPRSYRSSSRYYRSFDRHRVY
jgi:hypothetical protein